MSEPRSTLVPTRGGALGVTTFDPVGAPRATIVIAGGTGIPQRFYARYAAHLRAFGFRAVTFDHAGVGASKATPARDGMRGWARDAEDVVRWARTSATKTAKEKRLVYVGHSFGGQALGLMPDADALVDAAVLVGAQSGWYGHWPPSSRLQMAALWHGVVPALVGLFGRLPGWVFTGEDLPAPVAREWARWCRTPGYVTGALPADALCFSRYRGELLAFAFTDDDYAPASAVDELLSWYRNAAVEKRTRHPARVGVRAIGHLGFFRRTHAALWDESVEWIERALLDHAGRTARKISSTSPSPIGRSNVSTR